VAVAALLDPQVAHAERLAAQALRPEQVAVALEHADDVVVAQLLRAHVCMLRLRGPATRTTQGARQGRCSGVFWRILHQTGMRAAAGTGL